MTRFREIKVGEISIDGGFWKDRQDINRSVTIFNVQKRFEETGRFAALRHEWKEGQPDKPHIFWDSDIAKWIEGAAYIIAENPDERLEKTIDEVVDLIEKNRAEDGYFNSYFQVCEPEERFTVRYAHELYCAGHLMEAAVAYYEATGKKKFLNLMCDYADLIEKVFMNEKSADFETPGHEEIELALVKLFRATGEKRYLEMSRRFVLARGPEEDPYTQAHKPVLEQDEAVGHSVRAVYLYCAMADLALEYNDTAMLEAAKKLFRSITERKMYITGGIGGTCVGEAFLEDYNLPNESSYAETCAAIGLAFFAHRLSLLERDGSYADTVERVLFNGFLCGVSLDGKSFFYDNANEINLQNVKSPREQRHNPFYPLTQRVEVFSCSCCPPNVVRIIAELGNYVYSTDGETVMCNQYAQSRAEFDGTVLTQKTCYPHDGRVEITLNGKGKTLAMRIPGWCSAYTLLLNGKMVEAPVENGYVNVCMGDGDALELNLEIKVKLIAANPRLRADCGRYAVTRGPLVFCLEGVDNGGILRDIKLPEDGYSYVPDSQTGVHVLTCTAQRSKLRKDDCLYKAGEYEQEDFEAKLIPYYAFANRGESDMLIWAMKK